ncbi:MAG: hypothetical protein AAB453_03555 [Patescibacteria group bacterium]
MRTIKPVRIFLNMPDYYSLAETIKQLLPSVGDQPTHVYVETAEEADLVFGIGWVEKFGLEGLVYMIGGARRTNTPREDLIWGETLTEKYGKKKAKEMVRGLG